MLEFEASSVAWQAKLPPSVQHWHPMWAQVQVLAAPFPIKLLVNSLGKIAEGGPITWDPTTDVEAQKKLPAPRFGWPSLGCYGHLGTELLNGRSFSR